MAIEALADLIADLGFNGIELPVRDGFQVEPDTIQVGLTRAVAAFEERGLSVYSVTGDLDEKTARACVENGVPVLRTMLKLQKGRTYSENVEAFQKQCLALSGALNGSDTTIGLQNHCDEFVSSSVGMMQAIDPLPEDLATAVLDLGHTGLEGELEEIAIDIAWPRLSLVNLKNALRYKDGVDARGAVIWNRTWVLGKEGYTSWDKAIAELAKRSFHLPICITCEYKDANHQGLSRHDVIPYLKEDLKYMRELLDIYYESAS